MVTAVPGRSRRAVNVTVKVSNTGQPTTTGTVTVGSLPVSPATRFDALLDVNATTEVEGGVPRYDANTDTYVVEKLDYSDITGSAADFDIDEIDGGTY